MPNKPVERTGHTTGLSPCGWRWRVACRSPGAFGAQV